MAKKKVAEKARSGITAPGSPKMASNKCASYLVQHKLFLLVTLKPSSGDKLVTGIKAN